MSLGWDIAGQLDQFRRQAESRFTETFEVFTTSDDLGDDGLSETVEDVVYEAVPGRMKYPSQTVFERQQGAQVVAVQDLYIHVAVGATPLVGVDTYWRCVGSTVDVSLIGRVYRTKGEAASGQVTAHRYPVERVT